MTIVYAVIAVVCVLVIGECIREAFTFQVKHYQIQSEKLNIQEEQKIVFLSDLHCNQYGKKNAKLLQAIREQKPDLILVGGDMVIGLPGTDTTIAVELAKELAQICPVYYANGNHEQRMRENTERYGTIYENYSKQLAQCGITILENQQQEILLENNKVMLCGLEIPPECFVKFRKTELSVDQIKERIGECDKEAFTILFAHNPKFMNTYLEWGGDLILSGHLHGGVARIPGWRGVIAPQGNLFPKYSGEHRKEENTDIIVSKGLGTHTIPLRFMNPAELIVIHVNGGNHGNTCETSSV